MENEYCTEDGLESIENGIIRVKIKCDNSLATRLSELTGVKKVFGYKTFLKKLVTQSNAFFATKMVI